MIRHLNRCSMWFHNDFITILNVQHNCCHINILHGGYHTPKTKFYAIYWFLDHKNIWLDTSIAVLCGFTRILSQFRTFGIMADDHNVLHGVYHTSHTRFYAINRFLDHENIWLDTLMGVVCGFISILEEFICFGIMAASDRARNTWKMHKSYLW